MSKSKDHIKKLIAILCADVKDYSRHMGRSEEVTFRLLNECRAIIDGLISSHGGRIANTAGDSVVAEFGSVGDAVICAVNIQEKIGEKMAGRKEDEKLAYRIGINLGDIIVKGNDILGDGVNVAARLEGIADVGGINISGSVYDCVKNKLPYQFNSLGEKQLKNIAEPVRVYQVLFGNKKTKSTLNKRSITIFSVLFTILIIVLLRLIPPPQWSSASSWRLLDALHQLKSYTQMKTSRSVALVIATITRDMVDIPAGVFQMGCEPSEIDCDKSELPAHRVAIKPFRLAKYEVTFAQWDACVADGGCKQKPDDNRWGRGSQPVINISWDDAQEFINWLNGKTSDNFRLPSETEWEYAARAGTTTKYPWGDDVGKNRANCVGCSSQWDDKQPAPVGSFPSNQFGLYDMQGNIWEWVMDCWHDNYNGAPSTGGVWPGGDCDRRVNRGGSYSDGPARMRSSDRGGDTPSDRDSFRGFRIAEDKK